jgi:hypothetical protein
VHQHCILTVINRYFDQACMNRYVPFFLIEVKHLLCTKG